MTNHTPGPWIVPPPPGALRVVTARDSDSIALIEDIDLSDAECEANAALIAAAPDLLTACEAAFGVLMGTAFETVGEERAATEEAVNLLHAAIAKAKGA